MKQKIVGLSNSEDGLIILTLKTDRSLFPFFDSFLVFIGYDEPRGYYAEKTENGYALKNLIGSCDWFRDGNRKIYIVWGEKNTTLILDLPKKECKNAFAWLKGRIEFSDERLCKRADKL